MARPITKRDDILRAALELFSEKGIAATTTRDIASRANSAEGTLYRYYPSKEDLAWDLYWTHFQAFVAQLQTHANTPGTTLQKLHRMITHYCQLYDHDPKLYAFLVLGEHWLETRIPPDAQTPPTLLLDLLTTAQTNRELHPHLDLAEAAALITGTIVRLTLFHLHGRVQGPLTTRAQSITDLCWRAIAR